jgi:hypothetical protein
MLLSTEREDIGQGSLHCIAKSDVGGPLSRYRAFPLNPSSPLRSRRADREDGSGLLSEDGSGLLSTVR